MTQDEILFVKELLTSPIKKLRKTANDTQNESNRVELIEMILVNELLGDCDIEDSFRFGEDEEGKLVIYSGHRELCQNSLGGINPDTTAGVEYK